MNQNFTIRRECAADYRIVENLTRESFWNVYQPGCTEHFVLNRYRDRPEFIPELDFVLELGDEIIGHVMFSKAEILADDGRSIPILTFGPISIAPAYKRQGYGRALLSYALDKAREQGYGAVFMEGNIDFYKHCGFGLASRLNIHYHAEPRESEVPYFLGMELQKGCLAGVEGVYHTPRAYYAAIDDPQGFELYESGFPSKEKLTLPGQL